MNLVKALKNYYAMNMGLMFAIIGIVGAVLYGAGIYGSGDIEAILICVAIIAIGALIVVLKYLRVKKYFEYNVTVRATVTGSRFFRRWGTISYTYTFEGTEYKGKMLVARNGETRGIEKGSEIGLLLDKNNAEKSLIEDILR